jgi:hypothetical protein
MTAMNATAATSVSINILSCDNIDGVTVMVSVNVLYSVLYSVAVKILYSIIVLYTVVVVGGVLRLELDRHTYLLVLSMYCRTLRRKFQPSQL